MTYCQKDSSYSLLFLEECISKYLKQSFKIWNNQIDNNCRAVAIGVAEMALANPVLDGNEVKYCKIPYLHQ